MTNKFQLTLKSGETVLIDLQPFAEWLSNVKDPEAEVSRVMQIVSVTYSIMAKTQPKLAEDYLEANILLLSGTSIAA